MEFNRDSDSPPPSTQPTRSQFQWTRHPDPICWRDSRILVFLVESNLFKVDISSLAPHSEPLSTIFSIPPSTSNDEGTESNPITLEGISADDFSNFIRWVYHIDWNPVTNSEAVYLGIINVCRLYFIESGMKFAVHGLQGLQLDPSRMIQLALQYSLSDFVKPAVTKLFKPTPIDPTTFNPEQVAENAQAKRGFAPLRNLTPLNRAQLGFEAYAILAQAREAIDHEARLIAACAPPFVIDPSWECTNHTQCTKVWKEVWWNIIGRALLHPMRPTHLSDLIDLLADTKFPGMADCCKNDAIALLVEQDAFGAEREYIQMATELIIKLFNPNHISFSTIPTVVNI